MCIEGPADPVHEADQRNPGTTTGRIALRERIVAELREEEALARFQQERPDMWLQANRLAGLLDMQARLDEHHFPPGSCFVHAALPDASCFALRRLLEIDLETCQVTLEIHGDDVLAEGTVIIPLEQIAWFGFPRDALPLQFQMRGFTMQERPATEEDAPPAEHT